MGISFVLVGLVLIITGARDTYAQLGTQLNKDFTGSGNFTYWVVSIAAVGALGYIPALKTFSHWFVALILLALLLSHKGFFSKFSAALQSGPAAAPTSPAGSPAALPGSTQKTAPTVGSAAVDVLKSPIPPEFIDPNKAFDNLFNFLPKWMQPGPAQ